MAKLADESETFESKTIFGLLRGAPDLLPNINNVESMFQLSGEESLLISALKAKLVLLTPMKIRTN